ncbi:MAG: 30S ribosomal protein S19 [Candidatus Diapherotrites archaeon]|nr:30S ribosomal protein S19 [Candidatus Diapherotrites archaeon]
MARKEFKYRGMNLDDLLGLTSEELANVLPSRARRSMIRMDESHKKLLSKIRENKKSGKKIRTHLRDTVILPEMVGLTISVYNGKEYTDVPVTLPMVGHFLGEFSITRGRVSHSGPGIGATRSTKHVSVR